MKSCVLYATHIRPQQHPTKALPSIQSQKRTSFTADSVQLDQLDPTYRSALMIYIPLNREPSGAAFNKLSHAYDDINWKSVQGVACKWTQILNKQNVIITIICAAPITEKTPTLIFLSIQNYSHYSPNPNELQWFASFSVNAALWHLSSDKFRLCLQDCSDTLQALFRPPSPHGVRFIYALK